jgi:F0F1-type ATP synthase assembly protein I
MFNLWRHVRLAGIVMMLASTFVLSVPLLLYGFFTLLIGLTNGLLNIERRLEALELKGDEDEKAKTPKGN